MPPTGSPPDSAVTLPFVATAVGDAGVGQVGTALTPAVGVAVVGAVEGGAAPTKLREVAVSVTDVNGRLQVLLVDDDRTLREGCSSVLQIDGYAVTSTGRGDEAMDLLRRRKFDIVLVDLYLTPVSGMEILRAALAAHRDTIVIVMTGNPSVATSIEALRAGAWDYLPKPFSAQHMQILLGRASHAVAVARETRDLRHARCRPEWQQRPHHIAGRFAGVPSSRRAGPQGRVDGCLGDDQWRVGDRQGTDRAVHPPAQSSGQPEARPDQLCRAARAFARVGDVRAPEGRVHGSGPRQGRVAGDGQRWDAIPR